MGRATVERVVRLATPAARANMLRVAMLAEAFQQRNAEWNERIRAARCALNDAEKTESRAATTNDFSRVRERDAATASFRRWLGSDQWVGRPHTAALAAFSAFGIASGSLQWTTSFGSHAAQPSYLQHERGTPGSSRWDDSSFHLERTLCRWPFAHPADIDESMRDVQNARRHQRKQSKTMKLLASRLATVSEKRNAKYLALTSHPFTGLLSRDGLLRNQGFIAFVEEENRRFVHESPVNSSTSAQRAPPVGVAIGALRMARAARKPRTTERRRAKQTFGRVERQKAVSMGFLDKARARTGRWSDSGVRDDVKVLCQKCFLRASGQRGALRP